MLLYRLALAKGACSFAALIAAVVFSQTAFSQSLPEMPPDPFGVDARQALINRTERKSNLTPEDGELDPTFAPSFDFANGFAYATEELPDGKVLAAGSFKSINGFATASIVRFNADRSVDTSFSAVIRGSILRIAVQPDGKIIIAGSFNAFGATSVRFGVARLNANGSLDETFISGTGPDALVRDLILQPDGKVIIAGDFTSVNGIGRLGVARLNTDGSVDGSFNSPVVPSAPFSAGAVSSVGLRSDGKIILGGAMRTATNPSVRWVLRLNSDGSVDESFSSPTMNSNPWELAVQPDGKIVLVGFFTTINSTSRPRIGRLNADGSLDSGFTPGTGANASAFHVRLLASGKMLVSGSFSNINGTARGGLALLNADGTLDGSFAPTGTTVGTIYSVLLTATGDYYASGSFTRISGSDRNTIAALDPDGSIDSAFTADSLNFASVRASVAVAGGKTLVGGFFNRMNGSPVNSVVRLLSNGTADPTFSSGVTITGTVFDIVIQPDGKLLAIGAGIRVNNGVPQAMVRLTADGTPDATFTLATISQIAGGSTAAVQPDGKILFSYTTTSVDPTMNSALVRLNSNGSLDAGFQSATIPIEAIAVLSDGKILAAGPFAFAYVSSFGGTFEPHNAVIRLNADGSHDRTFQSALTAETPNISQAYSMYLQPDGRIVLGGRLFTASTGPTALGLVRLNATGTLDGSFQLNPVSSVFGIARVFAVQPAADGKLLMGGFFENYGGPGRTNVARVSANGIIDAAFMAGTDSTVSTISTHPSGGIVIGGNFEHVNGVARNGLARLAGAPAPADTAPFDFDGDGKTDIGIFRPSAGEWWIQRSSDGQVPAFQFGAGTDVIAPADYTGDGKTDVAFFRPSTGEWFVLRSENMSFFSFPFGANGDIPVPADYDGDGKADPAVFRPSSGTWFITRSSDGGTTISQFGASGDTPVPADYDGDGKADLAIYRVAAGEWWLNRTTAGSIVYGFGNSTDKPVQGDYTGDGKADVAFWRPSTGEWFILRSEDTSYYSAPFGGSGDMVVPGDYDGDGKFDTAVFRPSSATWFVQRTTAGTLIQNFGANGDRPIPNSFVP